MQGDRLDIRLPESTRPILVVVIDTEEEFDWSADFSRDATSVKAITLVSRLQAVFDEFEIRPVYVIDYPIASKPEGAQALGPIISENRALIGAHLHAWVNPPFDEALSRPNSYQRNLEPRLEREKLAVLSEAIESAFGDRPVIHKAGRYGIGAHTAAALADLRFEIDISVVPAFDYSGDGGPDFRQVNQNLFWFGPRQELMGIPNTGGFVGWLREHGPRVYAASKLQNPLWSLVSRCLSRGRSLERILLSPEGHSLDKLMRLTRALIDQGYRALTFSLHSPTVMPGGTPYAQSEYEVGELLDKCRRYFEFFLRELDGQTMSPLELKAFVQSGRASADRVATSSGAVKTAAV